MRISDWSSDVCSSDLRRVVVAGDPGPVEARQQLLQPRRLGRVEARRGRAVVEGVAEADDPLDAVAGDDVLQLVEGRRGVVGRQELAAGGEGGRLLEVQVGHRREAALGTDRKSTRLNSSPSCASRM